MLLTEWNWDDALAVRWEEGREWGLQQGLEQGREEIARNALSKGMSPEAVGEITGLDSETIRKLSGK